MKIAEDLKNAGDLEKAEDLKIAIDVQKELDKQMSNISNRINQLPAQQLFLNQAESCAGQVNDQG